MNANIKEDLVKALRSGDYVQCFGALRESTNNHYKYCPMGIICKLHQIANNNPESWWSQSSYTPTAHYYLGDSFIPLPVVEWAGLPGHNPILRLPDGKERSLSYTNDSLHLTFNEIADLIEEQL